MSSLVNIIGSYAYLTLTFTEISFSILPNKEMQIQRSYGHIQFCFFVDCSVVGFGKAHPIRAFPRMIMGFGGKDVAANDDKIYAMLNNVKVSHVREYDSEAALRENNITTTYRMKYKCTGTGHVVYKGSVYCNKYQSNRIVKYNLETGESDSEKMRDADFNNSFPYTSGSLSDFDFAVDEKGLWVIYTSVEYNGNLVVAQLDGNSLLVTDRFVTTFPKTSASNTFMVSGRLYVTGHNKDGPITVKYIYDTTSNRSVPVSEGKISFPDNSEFLTMLDYNSKEHKLYGWRMSDSWDGQLVTYNVHFATT